jgi:hypothetical protein
VDLKPKKVRPGFLQWAVRGMINSRGDWVFIGSENEANAFLVEHYFRAFPYDKYGALWT